MFKILLRVSFTILVRVSFAILLRVLFCANFALFHTLFPTMSDCVRFVRDFVLMSAFFVILLRFFA